MNDKRILVWFRNDLRIHDHQPLFEAIKKADEVIPVFCIDTRLFDSTKYQSKKTGVFRTKFILESIADLRKSLKIIGGDLIVRTGITEDIITELASQFQVNSVYAYKEVASEEVNLGDLLEQKLWKIKIPVNLYLGNTLFNKEDLPFPIKDLPDMFTSFRKKVEKDSFVRKCFETPTKINVPKFAEWGEIPTLQMLGFEEITPDTRAVLTYEGGETAGLNRLKHYLSHSRAVDNYKKTRNQLIGSDYSSKFSAWLSLGCISPRKIYHELKQYESEIISNESTYWLFFELLWRDYFRFVFKKYGNKLFRQGGLKGQIPEWNKERESKNLEKWKTGNTGIPFIDANMRELLNTGFMSNRGRQNVASFLVKDLKVNWTLGAAWFEEMLIDYNPASNWGNWAYLAGVGNDPREDRYFNILKQANDYDAKGEYVRLWIPELKSIPNNFIHQPHLMTNKDEEKFDVILGKDYPNPIVEFKKFEKYY